MQFIVSWSQTRQPWLILFITAFSLVCAALVFQHIYNYQPCIKCIYQRTAMIGICLAALLPLIKMHWSTRIMAIIVWTYSAAMGLIIANEHLEVIFADSFLMPPCPIVPNFPSFMPLHDWLPAVFDGIGDCADNRWQFIGMGMAEWMRIIFALYLAAAAVVVLSYIIRFRQVAK